MKNISVINAACRARDAIGETVHETCRTIAEATPYQCRLFTYQSDAADIDTRIIRGPGDVLSDPFFLASDACIVHFGFYTPLMGVLLGGRRDMVRIARYHNITAKEFVAPEMHDLIDMSRRQIPLLNEADEIWADSPYNRDDLVESGISPNKISVSPLFVKSKIKVRTISSKLQSDCVSILYVGRFVPSKGVIDLLKAVQSLTRTHRIRLRLVGALVYSDHAYIADLKQFIADHDLGGSVEFVGEATDEELARLYDESHVIVIPSYHEGFCVPLAEGLIAGLIPIAYASGNVPHMIGGVGNLVPTGDVQALTQAIAETVEWLERARSASEPVPLRIDGAMVLPHVYEQRVASRTSEFDLAQFRTRITSALAAALDRRQSGGMPS